MKIKGQRWRIRYKKFVVYECDPEKNAECKKTMCPYNTARDKRWPPCGGTLKPEMARLDENGRPIITEIRLRPVCRWEKK